MKRKRLLLILGFLAAALLAGYGTLRLTAPRHRITKENYRAIQKGMAEEEVEAILGAKASVHADGIQTGLYFLEPYRAFTGIDLIERHGGKEWVGEEIGVYIRFDEGARVLELHRGPVVREESFLAKLRRWLGMQ